MSVMRKREGLGRAALKGYSQVVLIWGEKSRALLPAVGKRNATVHPISHNLVRAFSAALYWREKRGRERGKVLE